MSFALDSPTHSTVTIPGPPLVSSCRSTCSRNDFSPTDQCIPRTITLINIVRCSSKIPQVCTCPVSISQDPDASEISQVLLEPPCLSTVASIEPHCCPYFALRAASSLYLFNCTPTSKPDDALPTRLACAPGLQSNRETTRKVSTTASSIAPFRALSHCE